MLRSPEAKLMGAIFMPGECFKDSDLHQVVAGETLRDALYKHIEQLAESRLGGPAFKSRVKRIIELRFGFKDGRSQTLKEVGREFGVSRERIRQIEAKALRMLRHPGFRMKLEPFIKEEDYD